VHRVRIDGFWMDRTPVTNREFSRFVEATAHVTLAEIAPDPKGYPGALPHMLKAGSLVFTPPRRAVDLRESPKLRAAAAPDSTRISRLPHTHRCAAAAPDRLSGRGGCCASRWSLRLRTWRVCTAVVPVFRIHAHRVRLEPVGRRNVRNDAL
jgi:hypothetical protein